MRDICSDIADSCWSDIGNGMSLSMRDEGDDCSRTSSVSFSCAAANSLKLMMTFGSTCNVFTCTCVGEVTHPPDHFEHPSLGMYPR